MRKIIGIVAVVLSGLILFTAMNQSFINKIKQDRYFAHLVPTNKTQSLYQRVFIRTDRWRYGDLYGMCYLPQYQFALTPYKQYIRPTGSPLTNRVMYIIGDSFLADKVLSGAFTGFDEVHYLDRRFPIGKVSIDSTKENYMMLEFAERNLNTYTFTGIDETPWKANTPVTAFTPLPLSARINSILFNKNLNRNIELLIFEDQIFGPIKQAKSWLNYTLFGRLPKEVAVSTDKKRLFLNVSVDTASEQSAFTPRSGEQIKFICNQLASAQKYYTSIGFKKVYLASVPNAVTLYDDKRMAYNHLLERIEQQTTLPVISVLKKFKGTPDNLFYLSDAHWNPEGLDRWVTEANKVLQSNFNARPTK